MATRKYKAGVECLMRAGVKRPSIVAYIVGDHARLFRVLRDMGFRWNPNTGDWVHKA